MTGWTRSGGGGNSRTWFGGSAHDSRGWRPTAGRVEKWKLEGGGNSAEYEFDIHSPGNADEDYEVQVDAYSGQLRTAG
ncbi:PepSY domain-containing protein [Nocardia sp. Marseille-Q1738]